MDEHETDSRAELRRDFRRALTRYATAIVKNIVDSDANTDRFMAGHSAFTFDRNGVTLWHRGATITEIGERFLGAQLADEAERFLEQLNDDPEN